MKVFQKRLDDGEREGTTPTQFTARDMVADANGSRPTTVRPWTRRGEYTEKGIPVHCNRRRDIGSLLQSSLLILTHNHMVLGRL